MSIKYRNASGQEVVVSGLTPGGDIEAGAVMTRTGTFTIVPSVSTTNFWTSGTVTFDEPMPDTDYMVEIVSTDGLHSESQVTCTINAKTVNGFSWSAYKYQPNTATMKYTVWKTYTVQHAAQNAEDITNIKAVIPSTASSTNQLTPKKYVDDADTALDGRVSNLEDLIPNNASVTNQLATKAEINNVYTKADVDTKLDDKQDTLTFDNEPTAGSSNPVKSNGIKSAIDDTATDIYKVMGKNGAKNLIPYPYLSASSSMFTINSDGSVLVNGTAGSSASRFFFTPYHGYYLKAGSYILSDGRENHSSNIYLQVYDSLSPYTSRATTGAKDNVLFTLEEDTEVVIQLNVNANTTVTNDLFYPMLRLAEDTDSTYQPYAETNYQLTQDKMSYADNGILGAKNLLPIEVSTQTISNVTYTVNSDGTMDIQGQNTSGSWISLNVCSFSTLKSILSKYKGKQMIFSITSDYDYDTRNVCLYYNIGGTATYVVPNPKEKTFTVPNNIDQATSITVPVGVNTGETASTTNLGIMLRLANDADSNYAPYAMTNRELTEHHTTVAKTFTQSSTDVATYLRNANTSSYIALGYSYNRTMITINAIFTIKASGNALYKSDGTTATSGNENWELIKIPNFPYSKAIPDGPLAGLLFLNTTDLKDLYCRKSGNDLIFTIGATDYAYFVGKGIRLSATIMLK